MGKEVINELNKIAREILGEHTHYWCDICGKNVTVNHDCSAPHNWDGSCELCKLVSEER
jgi:hypothetical protein